MTFLPELKRLNMAIRSESNAFTRFGLIQQRDALFSNHAAEIAALVDAAQVVVDLDDGDKPDLWHFESEFAALRDALAALNAEKP